MVYGDQKMDWGDVEDDSEEFDSASSEDEGALGDDELRARLASGNLKGAATELPKAGRNVSRAKGSLDEAGISSKLKEFAVLNKLSWKETFVMPTEAKTDPVSASDDFARENYFYEQTLVAAVKAMKQLKKEKVPIHRPDDYYAEMLKTDDHMKKIKEKMLHESKRIEASERARKQRDNAKYGKKVQVEILQKRQVAKKEAISAANKFKKGLQQKTDNNKDDFDVEASSDKPQRDNKGDKGGGKGREKRNAKFGFGGSKNNSRAKRNDGESFNSSNNKKDHFSATKNNADKKRAGKKGGAKGGAKNGRPGKSKRSGSGKR